MSVEEIVEPTFLGRLMLEVARFQDWALGYDQSDGRYEYGSGEWECNYDRWSELYDAVLKYAASGSVKAWPDEAMKAVLYAVARDREDQYLAEEIRVRHSATLVALAEAVLTGGEADAKWQLAEELGRLCPASVEVERLLLILARDEHEYVRRRALEALNRIGSSAVEQLARAALNEPVEQSFS